MIQPVVRSTASTAAASCSRIASKSSVGAGVVEHMNIGKTSTEYTYVNMRAQLWFDCRNIAKKEGLVDFSRLTKAQAAELKRQLMAQTYEFRATDGAVLCTPKDKIKELIKRSPDTADAVANQIGDTLNTSISRMLTNFGASASRLEFGIGFDQDPQGKADNRIASFLRDANGNSILDNTAGRGVGRDEATLQAELGTETKRLMLAALQAVGPTLENGFGEIFARLDPATAAPEAIDNLFALAGQLKALGDAAERLPGVMGTIADLSAVAREELIGLAGGIDSLTSGLQTYYQEFFTAEEQLANAGNNLRTDFAKIGLSFDALAADSDGPRQAFRDLFEGLDLTTVGGRQSAAALLALVGVALAWRGREGRRPSAGGSNARPRAGVRCAAPAGGRAGRSRRRSS